MKTRLPEGMILICCIVGLLLIWLSDILLTHQEMAPNAITETGAGDGYRYFFDFKNKIAKGSARHWRRPLLNADDLKPLQTYFLLSPKRPLSPHETKVLMDWVKGGGRLILSFRDEKTMKRIDEWLRESSLQANKTSERPDFKNGAGTEVTATGTLRFMPAAEKYVFYSYLEFQDSSCASAPETCFVRETSVGVGEVVRIAGLPPFANALLGLQDNAKLATRFAYWTGPAAFDEFHQFLTEKSLMDMLTDPSLIFPLLGFLLLVLLYFFLGSGDLVERELRHVPRTVPVAAYHQLGRELARRAIAGGPAEAYAWHEAALIRLLPEERRALSAPERAPAPGGSGGDRVMKLIVFHQEWLKLRGRSKGRDKV